MTIPLLIWKVGIENDPYPLVFFPSDAFFFSVLRLLGFRQVVAQARLCISELCRNMLSLRFGSIKREHGSIHSPVWATQNRKTQTATKHHTQTQTTKSHNKANKKALSYWTGLLCANQKPACAEEVGPCVKQTNMKPSQIEEARRRCKEKLHVAASGRQ